MHAHTLAVSSRSLGILAPAAVPASLHSCTNDRPASIDGSALYTDRGWSFVWDGERLPACPVSSDGRYCGRSPVPVQSRGWTSLVRTCPVSYEWYHSFSWSLLVFFDQHKRRTSLGVGQFSPLFLGQFYSAINICSLLVVACVVNKRDNRGKDRFVLYVKEKHRREGLRVVPLLVT